MRNKHFAPLLCLLFGATTGCNALHSNKSPDELWNVHDFSSLHATSDFPSASPWNNQQIASTATGPAINRYTGARYTPEPLRQLRAIAESKTQPSEYAAPIVDRRDVSRSAKDAPAKPALVVQASATQESLTTIAGGETPSSAPNKTVITAMHLSFDKLASIAATGNTIRLASAQNAFQKATPSLAGGNISPAEEASKDEVKPAQSTEPSSATASSSNPSVATHEESDTIELLKSEVVVSPIQISVSKRQPSTIIVEAQPMAEALPPQKLEEPSLIEL